MDEDIIQLVIAIEVANQDTINAGIAAQFPNAGPDTFTSLFSSDGNEPATHAVCSWGLTPANITAVVNFLTSDFADHFQYFTATIPNVKSRVRDDWSLYPVNNI